MSMELNLRGTEGVAAALTTVAYRAREAAMQALREEAEIELAEAKRRTPVKTGFLRGSGHVEGPTDEGNRLKVDIVFSASYAVPVHEDTERFHANGQAKFLESVLLESAKYMPERIRSRMARILGTGGAAAAARDAGPTAFLE